MQSCLRVSVYDVAPITGMNGAVENNLPIDSPLSLSEHAGHTAGNRVHLTDVPVSTALLAMRRLSIVLAPHGCTANNLIKTSFLSLIGPMQHGFHFRTVLGLITAECLLCSTVLVCE